MQLPLLSFSEFLDMLPDATLVVDDRMNILLANEQAHLAFGFPPGALQGESVQALVPIHNRDIHAQFAHEFFANPTTRPMGVGLKLCARRGDGREFPVEIMLRPFRIADSLFVLCLVRDMTDRFSAEAALRQSHDKYRHLVENALGIFVTKETGARVLQDA